MSYELDYKAQGTANRRLLAAVVALAIQDAQSKLEKRTQPYPKVVEQGFSLR